jgi:DnaD/phage-associated family protein
MNFFKEFNAFRDYLMINRLATGQIALWYALMQINNMTGWTEWFTSANQTLQLMTGLSRQGLDKARNQLVQVGLIEYVSGTTRQASKYKIKPIMLNSRLISSQVVDKSASNQESNGRLIGSTLLDLDKDYISTTSSYERARKIFQNEIGIMTAMIDQRLCDDVDVFTSLWVENAIYVASKRGKRSYAYVHGVLDGWKADGFKESQESWEVDVGGKSKQSRTYGRNKPGYGGSRKSQTDWDSEPSTLGGG